MQNKIWSNWPQQWNLTHSNSGVFFTTNFIRKYFVFWMKSRHLSESELFLLPFFETFPLYFRKDIERYHNCQCQKQYFDSTKWWKNYGLIIMCMVCPYRESRCGKLAMSWLTFGSSWCTDVYVPMANYGHKKTTATTMMSSNSINSIISANWNRH